MGGSWWCESTWNVGLTVESDPGVSCINIHKVKCFFADRIAINIDSLLGKLPGNI